MDLGGWRAAGQTGRRPKGKPSSSWDWGWQIKAEGMSPCHQDSMQWLAHSKDKAGSALTCSLPDSVVLGQSLLTEKDRMADSQHWGHANKRACRKESAETAKQCKSSLYSRKFSQLTLIVSICSARLPEMSEIQKNVPGTQALKSGSGAGGEQTKLEKLQLSVKSS